MSPLSRRTFVATSAALLPASKLFYGRARLRSSNLGVQLYTVRNVIMKDPVATLKAIQDIGYQEVEATYAGLDQIMAALQKTSLKPVSIHVDTSIFMEGSADLDRTLADIKERGFQYVVVPYIPPAQRGGPDMFKNLAEKLNKAGQKATATNLKLCYHNHAFEYQPMNGTTGLDILMSNTEKGVVSLELDVFWASAGGHNPVEILNKYSGRVLLVHLKDKARNFTKTQYNENVPKDAFKEVGSGSLDFPAILKAADAAGVENYFVEQDQTPGDPIASLGKSYNYLKDYFNS
ncbi:MAG: TIM barrel protein [Acidobacteriaceae bacterium]|nr:TIM barrel protein [Acidobacteriaceae bacterium]